jgi:hypothetical protein
MNTDHIVHNSATQLMECQHCGFTQSIKMPAPIDAILGTFDAFTKAHEGCKRPQGEAVMSDYIKGFDAGYSYVLNEIELWQAKHYNSNFPVESEDLSLLVAHLKMEGKSQ